MKSRYHAGMKGNRRFVPAEKKPATPSEGFRDERPRPLTKLLPKHPPFRVEG